jgi:hypothetical protein
MTPTELEFRRLTLRITALESMVALLSAVAIQTEDGRAQLSAELASFPDRTGLMRFPGLSPEESDLLAQEGREYFQSLAAFMGSWVWKPHTRGNS